MVPTIAVLKQAQPVDVCKLHNEHTGPNNPTIVEHKMTKMSQTNIPLNE